MSSGHGKLVCLREFCRGAIFKALTWAVVRSAPENAYELRNPGQREPLVRDGRRYHPAGLRVDVTQRFTTKRIYVVTGLGIGQILSWGSTFYLLAVLAGPIVTDTGWSSSLVVAGVSLGLVIAGLGSPRVGALVASNHGRIVLIASALMLALGLATLGLAPNLNAAQLVV